MSCAGFTTSPPLSVASSTTNGSFVSENSFATVFGATEANSKFTKFRLIYNRLPHLYTTRAWSVAQFVVCTCTSFVIITRDVLNLIWLVLVHTFMCKYACWSFEYVKIQTKMFCTQITNMAFCFFSLSQAAEETSLTNFNPFLVEDKTPPLLIDIDSPTKTAPKPISNVLDFFQRNTANCGASDTQQWDWFYRSYQIILYLHGCFTSDDYKIYINRIFDYLYVYVNAVNYTKRFRLPGETGL